MSEAKFFHITTAGKMVGMPTAARAIAAAKKGGYLWLDYCEPSREELSALIEPLGLHPLAIEDCTDNHQIPKIDDYGRHTFMLFNSLQYADRTLLIHEVDVFIGANFLVSVHQRDASGQPVLAGLERQAEIERENVRH